MADDAIIALIKDIEKLTDETPFEIVLAALEATLARRLRRETDDVGFLNVAAGMVKRHLLEQFARPDLMQNFGD